MNNYEYFSNTVNNINELFSNSFLNHVQVLNHTDFLFSFSKNNNGQLFISLNNNMPFFAITSEKYTINQQSIFFNRIKNKIYNAKFIRAELANKDNILVLEFSKISDTYDKVNYLLIFELFKASSNIILLSNNKIIDCYRQKGLETKRPIIIGGIYEFPPSTNFLYEINSENYQKYINSIESLSINDKYKYIKITLKSKLKSLNKKVEKLNNEQVDAQNKLIYKDFGDFLLTNKDDLYYKQSFIYDEHEYFLDNKLNYEANIQKFYKTYKKAKQTILISKEYITQANDEIDYLNSILSTLEIYNESDYLNLIDELEHNGILKAQKVKKKVVQAIKPYFITFNNVKIGYGKNNYQNDFLTFKLASKKDYFLHINKAHGPHVIIFSENPTNEIKELASEISIYLSSSSLGDVIYAKVSTIKKGNQPGLVLLSNYETFHINNFKYDIASILKDAKRF